MNAMVSSHAASCHVSAGTSCAAGVGSHVKTETEQRAEGPVLSEPSLPQQVQPLG